MARKTKRITLSYIVIQTLENAGTGGSDHIWSIALISCPQRRRSPVFLKRESTLTERSNFLADAYERTETCTQPIISIQINACGLDVCTPNG